MGRGEANSELSDLGVPRPPMVDEAPPRFYNFGAALKEAYLETHAVLWQKAREIAMKEPIPRGHFADKPHSEYVEDRTPTIYNALVAELAKYEDLDPHYTIDSEGRKIVFIKTGFSPNGSQIEVVYLEDGLRHATFPLEHYQSRSQIEKLWLACAGNLYAMYSAANEGSYTHDRAAYYAPDGTSLS
jgi:hypothetical protein